MSAGGVGGPKYKTPGQILVELARQTEAGGTVHAQLQMAASTDVDPAVAAQLGLGKDLSPRGMILWVARDRWTAKGEAQLTAKVAKAHDDLDKAPSPEKTLNALGRLAELVPLLRTMPHMGHMLPDVYWTQLTAQCRDRSLDVSRSALGRLLEVAPKGLNLEPQSFHLSGGELKPLAGRPNIQTIRDAITVSAERVRGAEEKVKLKELAAVIDRLQLAGDIDPERAAFLAEGAAIARALSKTALVARDSSKPVPATVEHLKSIEHDLGLLADFARAFPDETFSVHPNYVI